MSFKRLLQASNIIIYLKNYSLKIDFKSLKKLKKVLKKS